MTERDLGVHDVGDGGTDRQQVADPEHRAADRRRARRLHLQAAALVVAVFVVGTLAP